MSIEASLRTFRQAARMTTSLRLSEDDVERWEELLCQAMDGLGPGRPVGMFSAFAAISIELHRARQAEEEKDRRIVQLSAAVADVRGLR